MPSWKAAVVMCGSSAILFILFGGLTLGFEASSILFLAFAGATIGAIAVPELGKKKPKWATVWQVLAGAIGGTLVAITINPSVQVGVVGFILGIFLGYIAPLWIRHIQLP